MGVLAEAIGKASLICHRSALARRSANSTFQPPGRAAPSPRMPNDCALVEGYRMRMVKVPFCAATLERSNPVANNRTLTARIALCRAQCAGVRTVTLLLSSVEGGSRLKMAHNTGRRVDKFGSESSRALQTQQQRASCAVKRHRFYPAAVRNFAVVAWREFVRVALSRWIRSGAGSEYVPGRWCTVDVRGRAAVSGRVGVASTTRFLLLCHSA